MTWSPESNVIDNTIKSILDDIFFENTDMYIFLDELIDILKQNILCQGIYIKYNNKIRNISSYLNKNHGSLSKFIANNTDYHIHRKDKQSYISFT